MQSAVLERVHCVKPSHPQWEGTEDSSFMNPIKSKMVRGAPACSKSFAVDLFFVSDLRAGDADAQLEELSAMCLIGHQGTRSHVAALTCQRQGGYSDHNGHLYKTMFIMT